MIPDNYVQLHSTSKIIGWQVEIANELNRLNAANPKPTIAVCILDGGFMMYTHVIKNLDFQVTTEFIKYKSYDGMEKGDVDIFRFPNELPGNCRIIIIDDIIDSGRTAIDIAKYYTISCKPYELVLVSLYIRKQTNQDELFKSYNEIYYGAELDDEWIVGYGCNDDKGEMRHIPRTYKVIREND